MYRNLEAEFRRRGIRRIDIATHFNIAISTVTLRLQGKSDITLEWALAIKKWLGVDMPLEKLFEKSTGDDAVA